MNKEDYSRYRQTDQWACIKRDVLERFGYRCAVCAKAKNLQVHHNCYDNLGSEDILDLVLLCDECHGLFHVYSKNL